MTIYTPTGTRAQDLWHVDGTPDFGVFPGGIIPDVAGSVPIWLKVGTSAYGEKHIRMRHGHWVRKHANCVAELVYLKLGHSGQVYCTEDAGKIKISMRLNPSALLVLDLVTKVDQPHMSVTTLYFHQGPLDGDLIGRYPGRPSIRF